MRQSMLSLALMVASAGLVQAQAGPCTESLIKQGHLPVAEDAFAYMPPYGKPVVGKSEIQATNQEKFGERTNIKSSYLGEHRIVASSSGDMAFEHGTLQVSYDDKGDGKHHEFKAVILNVYKGKDGVCQKVAGTMQPLEE